MAQPILRQSNLDDSYKVILVDDDIEVLQVLEDFVESLGLTAASASDACQALDMITRYKDDVIMVVSDYKMPDSTGISLRRDMPADYHSIPFVLMTGYNTPELAVDAIGKRVAAIIDKPLNFDIFKKLVFEETQQRISDIDIIRRIKSNITNPGRTESKHLSEVLLVEDDQVDAEIVVRHLSNTSYQVTHARNLREAAYLTKRCHFDCILLDMNLPDSDGQTAFIELNRNLSSTPIIILTGHDSRAIEQSMIQFGAQDFLRKNHLNQDILESCIFHSIDRQKILTELEEERQKNLAQSQYKSEFIANVSHEIRTPLNSIIGFASLIETSDPRAQGNDYFTDVGESASHIKLAGQHLLGIVNDILDYSKIESGNLYIENIKFNLRTMLEETLGLFSTLGAKTGIEFGYYLSPSLDQRFLGDPGRIRQILCNFLNNAFKFTDKGSIILEVVEVEPKPGQSLIEFKVSDTGIGIATETLSLLFSPFRQANNSTSRIYGGTGLGLSISKKLSQLMGGEVGADSILGQGSQFWLKMVLEKPPQIPMLDSEETSTLRFLGRRVLLLGFPDGSSKIISQLLADEGCEVTSVDSFDECTTIARECHRLDQDIHMTLIHQDLIEGREAKLIQFLPRELDFPIAIFPRPGRALKETPLAYQSFLGYLDYLVNPKELRRFLEESGKKSHHGSEINPAKDGTLPFKIPLTTPRKRVLVVDDNVSNQMIASKMLQKLGHHVDVVGNGRESIEITQTFHYDMIFMDYQMPEMDGTQATREIRSLRLPYQPIIVALTASVLKSFREECLQSGMDDFLTKPVSLQDLHRILLKWFPPE